MQQCSFTTVFVSSQPLWNVDGNTGCLSCSLTRVSSSYTGGAAVANKFFTVGTASWVVAEQTSSAGTTEVQEAQQVAAHAQNLEAQAHAHAEAQVQAAVQAHSLAAKAQAHANAQVCFTAELHAAQLSRCHSKFWNSPSVL